MPNGSLVGSMSMPSNCTWRATPTTVRSSGSTSSPGVSDVIEDGVSDVIEDGVSDVIAEGAVTSSRMVLVTSSRRG